ncbi:hypothetical protein TCDM_01357 [Trypanosoma cruzi Dm28c]|uniref:Fe2OG dioxygenase domain-containing protein n=2 Tax=Trypanosoma cruzi TaxID=5693 RepID=V5BZD6_TRYCR|nr:hypothetical protein TCDM_01357 [Trypanosoma cruzi Dm28c]PBJ73917.1 hypothetical protein BCY84_13364 [Trypanosoma cruzi cruzi]PWU99697.1 hypothetical protein C4B63_8g528 [Trypanosoma cruzi]
MTADVGLLSHKEIGRARSRCRAWMIRLAKHLSPLDAYTVRPDGSEPLDLIALNAGVQAGVSPFALRQALLAYTQLPEDILNIYFSSLLPFALVHSTMPEMSLMPLVTKAFGMEMMVENALGVVCVIRVPNLWATGSSPRGGLSLLYLLCCRAGAVLDAIRRFFQPPTLGVDERVFHGSPPEDEDDAGVRVLFCEPIEEVPGLYIVKEFITQMEHDAIWSELKGPKAAALELETLAHRNVAHFNRRFYYGVNRVGVEGDSVNAKPAFYDWMQRRLKNEDPRRKLQDYPSVAQTFSCDQLTVNFYNYKDGDTAASGIAHHVDSHASFMDCIYIVSLGSHTVLEYSRHGVPPEVAETFGVFAAPRSLLLMTGESRYSWTHGIAGKRVDILSDRIPPVWRGDRVSLTWRCGRDAPHRRIHCICKELCDGE